MRRDGKCGLLLTLSVCVWGYLPASALAWPEAVPAPSKPLRLPQNSLDGREANLSVDTHRVTTINVVNGYRFSLLQRRK
jgi:hypothetical protein